MWILYMLAAALIFGGIVLLVSCLVGFDGED